MEKGSMRNQRFEDENEGGAFERPADRVDLQPLGAESDDGRVLHADGPERAGRVGSFAELFVPHEQPAVDDDAAPADRAPAVVSERAVVANPTRDPLDAYFRQISTGDLISREEEIALAKRIEAAQHALLACLSGVPLIVERVGSWAEDLREGRLRLGHLLEGAPPEVDPDAASHGDDHEKDQVGSAASDLRLIGDAAARLDIIAALGAELGTAARKRVATLARGKTPSRRTDESLKALLSNASAAIADLNLHQDRIADLMNLLRTEARSLRHAERELLALAGTCGVSQAELIDRFTDRELDPQLVRDLAALKDRGWRTLTQDHAGTIAKIAFDFKALAERLGMPIADFRATLAGMGQARRKLKRLREEMVRSHLRLVVAVAKKYRGYSSLDLPDLIQEGNLGLMRAVEKYNYRHGVRVTTYATWWIRQSITRAMADQGRMIRIPVHMGQTARKVQRERSKLRQQKGREPDTAEIAERSGVATTQVEQVMSLVSEPTSLDIPIGEDGDTTLADLIEAPDAVDPHAAAELASLRSCIAEALSELTPREERILRMRFGIGMSDHTLEQIGQVFGVTRERIRQIEAKALQKLRDHGHTLDTFAET